MPARPNVFAMLFDPRLVRPFVVDWERVARILTARLHREALTRPDDTGVGCACASAARAAFAKR
jgi:hypothetical protein